MLTDRIDAALSALADCRRRLPDLRDIYHPGAPERLALNDLLDALRRTDEVLLGRRPTLRID